MEYNQTTQEGQFPPAPETNTLNTAKQVPPFQNQQPPLPSPPKKKEYGYHYCCNCSRYSLDCWLWSLLLHIFYSLN